MAEADETRTDVPGVPDPIEHDHDEAELPETVPPVPDTSGPDDGGTLLDQLARERQEIAESVTEEFPVPNNGGLLYAEYRLLPWAQVRDFADQVERSRSRLKELLAMCDMLAAANTALYLRNRETGEREELPGSTEDHPLTFTRSDDVAAALKLGTPPKDPGRWTPRSVIRALLQRDLAVGPHHREVTEWMEGANVSKDREFAEG